MAGRKLTVVISQAPGKNPTKRHLEEEIATQLMMSGSVEVSLIPHLYDLPADHHGLMWLQSIPGDIVVLGWLYPRAIRWVLDRNGIRGKEGSSLIRGDDEEDAAEEAATEANPPQGIGSVNIPNRFIYTIDFRAQTDPAAYVAEIERITSEASVSLVSLGGFPSSSPVAASAPQQPASPFGFLGTPSDSPPVVSDPRRRWYPVIDYSRCTNCMECLDFCLFGVYGVDGTDRILVEEQDACKRGCPACSRVCPANAIIFPEHKTAAIAGAPTSAAGEFKIDLSKLFGAPSALEIAAQERDAELVADGREAVGLEVGIPKRQAQPVTQPRDALDDLVDSLDSLDF